jgi:hypothetical protein
VAAVRRWTFSSNYNMIGSSSSLLGDALLAGRRPLTREMLMQSLRTLRVRCSRSGLCSRIGLLW